MFLVGQSNIVKRSRRMLLVGPYECIYILLCSVDIITNICRLCEAGCATHDEVFLFLLLHDIQDSSTVELISI